MAFYSIEPFGEERDDLRAAQICAVVANKMRGKGGKTYKPSDFMPDFTKAVNAGPRLAASEPEQIWAQLHQFLGS